MSLIRITPESGGESLYLRPSRVTVEHTNEPWDWYPLPPPRWVRVKADGPASTPPVKRHFWERGR